MTDKQRALDALDEIEKAVDKIAQLLKSYDPSVVGGSKSKFKIIRECLSQPATPEGWNYNMDEAPRDGTDILLLNPTLKGIVDFNILEVQVAKCRWIELYETGWHVSDYDYYAIEAENPMAWMHLPAAPVKEEKDVLQKGK